jgi:broad specificity phosphatase PhoE
MFGLQIDGATRLIVVRHGETAGNVGQLLHGHTDLPLTELGQRQAERVAARIHSEFQVDAVVSSPLRRAHGTAAAIADRFGAPVELEANLMEINFGDYEGIAYAQVLADFPDTARTAFDPTSPNWQFPNGESRNGFNERVAGAFSDLASRHVGQTAVVVTHGGVLTSFLAQAQQLSAEQWMKTRFINCSLTSVEFVRMGVYFHAVNDHSHLDEFLSLTPTQESPRAR